MSTLYFRTNNDLLFWNVGYSSSLKVTIAEIPSLTHPRERIWEWSGEGGAETKILLTSSLAESDRAQAWGQKRATPQIREHLILIMVDGKVPSTYFLNGPLLFFFFFKYFIVYAITVVPPFPPSTPSTQPAPQLLGHLFLMGMNGWWRMKQPNRSCMHLRWDRHTNLFLV